MICSFRVESQIMSNSIIFRGKNSWPYRTQEFKSDIHCFILFWLILGNIFWDINLIK